MDRTKNRLLAATLLYQPFSRKEDSRRLLVRSLIYPLPFLGLVAVVVTRGWARSHLMLIAVTVYVTYLVPYLLVGYYRLYAIPLLGLQVMFETWGLDALWQRLTHRRNDSTGK